MNHSLSATLTGLWVGVARVIFYWLMHPWLVVTSLVLLIFLPAWVKNTGWRLSWRNPLLIALALYWLAITPPVASLAVSSLGALAPTDSGANAEAIVVLSRPSFIVGDRYRQAIQLWQAQRSPKIFVTAGENFRMVRRWLRREGLPVTILSGTNCALTTQDEALSTAAVLGTHNIHHIILITDLPHLARSVKTFEGVGFSVIPHASSLPHTLTSPQKMALALRESAGLLSYALLGRYERGDRQQTPSVLYDAELRQCKLETPPPDKEVAFAQRVP